MERTVSEKTLVNVINDNIERIFNGKLKCIAEEFEVINIRVDSVNRTTSDNSVEGKKAVDAVVPDINKNNNVVDVEMSSRDRVCSFNIKADFRILTIEYGSDNNVSEIKGQFYEFVLRFLIGASELAAAGFVYENIEKINKQIIDKSYTESVFIQMFIEEYFEKKHLPNYEFITQMACECYEKNECKAQIVFVEKYNDKCDLCFMERYTFSSKNMRLIRKLMEVVRNAYGASLIVSMNESGEWEVVGISHTCEQSHYRVRIEGKLSWKLFEGDEKEIIQYSKGIYNLNMGISNNSWEEDARRVKNEYGYDIKPIIQLLSKQAHGTAAILAERKYLVDVFQKLKDNNKAIPIEDFDLLDGDISDELKIGITNIDGALFISSDGKCFGIGAIVDGKTVIKGDRGRGSRYNSINNYVNLLNCENNIHMVVGIVVSEDGMIDVCM